MMRSPCLSTRLRSTMLDAQTGLRLLRSSCSNAAVIEEFSIIICNLYTDTSIEVYILPFMFYNIGESKEEAFFKVCSIRMTYILMAHIGF
jgi:hypothetical protein